MFTHAKRRNARMDIIVTASERETHVIKINTYSPSNSYARLRINRKGCELRWEDIRREDVIAEHGVTHVAMTSGNPMVIINMTLTCKGYAHTSHTQAAQPHQITW